MIECLSFARSFHSLKTQRSPRSLQSRVFIPHPSSFIPIFPFFPASLRLCGGMLHALLVLRGKLTQHSAREAQASRPFVSLTQGAEAQRRSLGQRFRSSLLIPHSSSFIPHPCLPAVPCASAGGCSCSPPSLFTHHTSLLHVFARGNLLRTALHLPTENGLSLVFWILSC